MTFLLDRDFWVHTVSHFDEEQVQEMPYNMS